MDVLDRIVEPLAIVGLFGMLAIIVGTAARCMRASIQGINDADDPRQAKLPRDAPTLQSPKYDRRMAVRSLKATLYWALTYFASAAILFVCLASGGWPRVSYGPELLFSLVVPLFMLRFFAYFLRLGRFFQPRQTARPKNQ